MTERIHRLGAGLAAGIAVANGLLFILIRGGLLDLGGDAAWGNAVLVGLGMIAAAILGVGLAGLALVHGGHRWATTWVGLCGNAGPLAWVLMAVL